MAILSRSAYWKALANKPGFARASAAKQEASYQQHMFNQSGGKKGKDSGIKTSGGSATGGSSGGKANDRVRWKPRSEGDGNLVVLSDYAANTPYSIVDRNGRVVERGRLDARAGRTNGFGGAARFSKPGSAYAGMNLQLGDDTYVIPDASKNYGAGKGPILRTSGGPSSGGKASGDNVGKFKTYAVNESMTNLDADRKVATMVEGSYRSFTPKKPGLRDKTDARRATFNVPDPWNAGGVVQAEYAWDGSSNRWQLTGASGLDGPKRSELPRYIRGNEPLGSGNDSGGSEPPISSFGGGESKKAPELKLPAFPYEVPDFNSPRIQKVVADAKKDLEDRFGRDDTVVAGNIKGPPVITGRYLGEGVGQRDMLNLLGGHFTPEELQQYGGIQGILALLAGGMFDLSELDSTIFRPVLRSNNPGDIRRPTLATLGGAVANA